jgi:uncharacterized membrane protein
VVDLNKTMYTILVVGMISSTAIYIFGLILFILQNPNPMQATLVRYASMNDFFQQMIALRASAILMVGTIVLIATPITRVFLSVLVFAANHDRKFVIVTGSVMLILIVSLILGYFWHLSIG